MDLDTYGRPTTECGSFIVSSAYPDEALWGTSFLARLSGSTAEFLSIWLLAMAGPAPFALADDGALSLTLAPALPAALFKEDGTASFRFLGGVDVTYHNPSGKDSWELAATKYVLRGADDDDGAAETVHGESVVGKRAKAVRALEYASVDVYLG